MLGGSRRNLCGHRGGDGHHQPGGRWFWGRWWHLVATLACGVFALVWLCLRSGSKPSRLTYPCQQAAFSTAALAFGFPIASSAVAARRRLLAAMYTPVGFFVMTITLLLAAGAWAYVSQEREYRGPLLNPPADYRARVFHVADCPQDPVGQRFVGLDNLITLMGRGGLKFYRSATENLHAGPDGIVAADDVVVIKINYQWDERGGTNVDVLRGLIRRIVDHPDTFTGEIVVCENAQFASVSNFGRLKNNAQDHVLSPDDVVLEFRAMGYTVSHYDWSALRFTLVDEYSSGDMNDGYIRLDYDPRLDGSVSYPKFRTSDGTYISLKHGLWDNVAGTYSREHLKFINVPVLKSHHASYGVTACVKNYMGVVTGALSTSSHRAIRDGILGALLGEIGLADLNILDCTWIGADPYTGPYSSYTGATRRDELVASVDPVAADIWATRNILIPAYVANGYSPPWPFPSADPDDPTSAFRVYLDRSMNYILAAGFDVTNDPDRIDVTSWNGAGDLDGDSDVDLVDFAELAGCVSGPGRPTRLGCEALDFDQDGHVDMRDFAKFQEIFTGPGLF